jgi:hypothetical protein
MPGPHLAMGAEMDVAGRAAPGFLEFAEMQREAELLLVRQILIAEY